MDVDSTVFSSVAALMLSAPVSWSIRSSRKVAADCFYRKPVSSGNLHEPHSSEIQGEENI
ncbi:MAG: hypothetical protein CME31_12040 [Gimesia sp.]|nr:hypothetical protein [Gimesia sp.]